MKKIIIVIISSIFLFFITIFINKLNNKNIFISYPNYKKRNLNRYKKEYKKNHNISKTIFYVNMNLDLKEYSKINTINYPNTLSLINKYNKLNDEYIPSNLGVINSTYTNKVLKVQKLLLNDLYNMLEDMKKNNLYPIITSAYRTKEYQEYLYNSYEIKDKYLDKYSARPRHSEHELGLAIDIIKRNGTLTNFYNTKEYIWLKHNSYKYGFILRYPNKENITKYISEPWHYRYITKYHSNRLHKLNITYEEYYYKYIK